LITEKVDWFLDKLVYKMARRTGKIVSILTLWRSLSFCGITRKKLQKAEMNFLEILQMNPFPGKNSVIIMDNIVIHHDEVLVELIKETDGKVVYLPPYLPDFNPIETAFSTLKVWFKRYRDFVGICDDIEYLILYALS
ncbi:hypothetical protein RclHR1_43870001, partial [Rhizophagus clarus]